MRGPVVYCYFEVELQPRTLEIHCIVWMQGQLEVTTLAGTGAAASREEDLVETKPFFLLSLDLPPARLFQDAMQEQIIPQVHSAPLFS